MLTRVPLCRHCPRSMCSQRGGFPWTSRQLTKRTYYHCVAMSCSANSLLYQYYDAVPAPGGVHPPRVQHCRVDDVSTASILRRWWCRASRGDFSRRVHVHEEGGRTHQRIRDEVPSSWRCGAQPQDCCGRRPVGLRGLWGRRGEYRCQLGAVHRVSAAVDVLAPVFRPRPSVYRPRQWGTARLSNKRCMLANVGFLLLHR
jgi:hypothetical protein